MVWLEAGRASDDLRWMLASPGEAKMDLDGVAIMHIIIA